MEIFASLQPCEFEIPQLVFYFIFSTDEISFSLCPHVIFGIQLDGIPNPSKEQLIDVVQRHFMTQVIGKCDTSFPLSLLRLPFHFME